MSIKVEGIIELNKVFDGLKMAVKNLEPAFKMMDDEIISQYKKNFDSKGKVLKSAWTPRKNSYPWPLLNKTGKLKNTWDKKSNRKSLQISNPVPYAKFHHFGLPPQLGKRKLVGTSRIINNIVIKNIIKYLSRKSKITFN